jgi:hypothetical protein
VLDNQQHQIRTVGDSRIEYHLPANGWFTAIFSYDGRISVYDLYLSVNDLYLSVNGSYTCYAKDGLSIDIDETGLDLI